MRGALCLFVCVLFLSACASTHPARSAGITSSAPPALPASLATPSAPSASNSVPSAETDAAWLIGTWKGDQSNALSAPGREGKVEITFSRSGEVIRWELYVRTFISSGSFYKADGVAKVSENHVALQGRYTGIATANLTYSLMRRGDILEGMGIGASNSPLRVSLTKIK